ncbi:endonuclease YncB(thermonuclease family) [Rhizobium sp. BK226]|uniref:thermonuclease family protein n=1 Tax=Rhizobium TaxID=379 RepID=UPI00161E7B7F|nr:MULTISPECIES: thermonuclease family protein [Rhizobium]MBB3297343.1 endonuclease YncB(thermonuclease family) [Rhizobium sp. BK112]MBB3368504.1 endonuclease YncB(thermonuclease family) [Rhizobium sp. BK077]MBB4110738.1 endonuclease YncB(thermonuclease family) [Rhizobium sp. BK226]MBB4177236.1 endonuclease YncB(thermonuclease family) [Rhizobium sp. BK109]UTS89568.1 thermonuclease family protein [Rhizobium anhuiense bv. trifolii]
MDPAGNLRNDIEAALPRQNLTGWQRTFLTDIHARLERSGGQARLSDNEWQKIFEILRRPNNVIALPPRPATAYPPRRQPSKLLWPRFSRAGRRLRWRLRNLAIGFLVVAAVAVGLQALDLGRVQFQSSPMTLRASQTQEFSVTDGDTVHVIGEAAGTRLVGFNTPEVFSPECQLERQLGERASSRLRELVAHGGSRLTKVACACVQGTEGTKKCNHGRYCGTLLVDGKDVGSILINEGLAVPFVCGRTSCPPTPRPWCKP